MFEREVSEDEVLNCTKLLYNKSWNDGVELSLNEMSEQHAVLMATSLVRERGWRQRISGAVIVFSYKIEPLVPRYIESFIAHPESHTCHSFIKMIGFMSITTQKEYLLRMLSSCTDDPYGNHLRTIIDNALKQLNSEG